MHYTRSLPLAIVVLAAGRGFAAGPPAAHREQAAATTAPAIVAHVGEHVPSEDTVVNDFHSLGLIDGRIQCFPVCMSGSRSGQVGRRWRNDLAAG